MNLEPNDPETALELYLADRENNVTDATIYSHRSRLGHFVRWCTAGKRQRESERTDWPTPDSRSASIRSPDTGTTRARWATTGSSSQHDRFEPRLAPRCPDTDETHS